MLQLQTYDPLPPLALTPPATRRSPALALLLSALCPGLGHLYIGLRRHAAWIFGMSLLCVLLLFGSGTLHAAALFSIPCLYGFALIDSYYSAREWNAGATPLMIGASPRIAAILNLLTKGFGYFYLGDRTKGILCFLAITVMQGLLALRNNIWTSVLAISLQVAVAVDAYRVGRHSLLAAHPELSAPPPAPPLAAVEPPLPPPAALPVYGNVIDQANQDGLQPALANVVFVLLGLVLLVGYAGLHALNGRTVVSRGTLENTAEGLLYRDQQEHLSLVLPEDWTPSHSQHSMALFTGDGASLLLQEQYAIFFSPAAMLQATVVQMLQGHKDATTQPCRAEIPGHASDCMEITYTNQNGTRITQRFIALRRSLKILTVIESWVEGPRPVFFDGIEKNLQLR